MDGLPQSTSAGPARDTAALCFVNALPAELLCEIFACLDDYRDQLTSTMVCRAWRETSLAAPARLWNYVVSNGSKPDVLDQALGRATNVPVFVTVIVLDVNASHVASAFQLHMHHIRHLSIQIGEDLEPLAAQSLAIALSAPAPVLETLIVMDVFAVIPRALDAVPHGSPLKISPKLSCLKLYGRARDYTLPTVFPSLSQFLYSPSDGLLSTTVVDNHISQINSLEILGLDFREWLELPQRSSAIRLPVSLKTLHLVCRAKFVDARQLLSLLLPGSIRLLTIDYTDGCDAQVATDLVSFMCRRFSPRDMSIFSSREANNTNIEAESHDGFVWEIIDISPELAHETFSNLHTLTISDPEWGRLSGSISALLLVSLNVRLITPYFMDEDAHRSLFLDMAASGRLITPKLRTLAFSTVPRESKYCLGFAPTLAPEMLCEFLHRKVEFAGDRLAGLQLNGVDLLQTVVESVVTLLSLVDDIQYGPGYNLVERRSVQRMSLDWEL